MDLSTLGKWIALAGIGLVVVGLLTWLAGKFGLPLGGLPGDIRVERPGWSFNFPVMTCIVLSILLTVVLNIILWFLRR
jgi:hypothetical protein